jgi:hypothetical protein
MKYVYENLGDDQFEDLVVFICQKLFGIGVQGFAKGVDGGRDAKFTGTAELHPSKAAPWVGTTIIQAKHTNGYNKSFSEKDFYNAKQGTKSVLSEEMPRIINLRETKELDHYILFANRKLTGNAHNEMVEYISTLTRIPKLSLYLCGIEQLEMWLKAFPEVAKNAGLDLVDSPLIISPDELSEVVEAFAKQRDTISTVIDHPPSERVSYRKKNALNKMSVEYANALRRRYLKDTSQIQAFLAAPENNALMRLYESTVDEFQLKIIANRKDYQTFDDVMEYLVDLLFGRDPVLRQHKRLTRTVLYYMYWNCDLGETDDAAANEALTS